MQYLGILNTTLSLELFHLQTNTSLELPAISVIRIGKPNEQVSVDIDVSLLPDADAVSRLHAEIHLGCRNYNFCSKYSSGSFCAYSWCIAMYCRHCSLNAAANKT